MVGEIPPGVVQMDKGAVDGGHALEHVLQALAEVVGVAQGDGLVEDDVDLDVELVARVVGLQALDAADRAREAHGQVQQDVAVGGRGGGAGEVPDVRRRGAGPVHDHVQREQQPAQGVQPPDLEVVPHDGEDDAEGVEDDVRERVLGQGLHRRVFDQPAPEPAAELDQDGAGHDGDGGGAQLHHRVVARVEPVEAFE